MKSIFIILIQVFFLHQFVFTQSEEDSHVIETKEQNYRETVIATTNSGIIKFYGKVVNEKDEPINNAKVKYFISRFDNGGSVNVEDKSINTGKDGLFYIEGLSGYSLRIFYIKKFEYTRNLIIKGEMGEIIFTEGHELQHKPEPSKPFVYKMVNELTDIICLAGKLETGKSPSMIFKSKMEKFNFDYSYHEDEENHDLVVNVKNEKDSWNIEISSSKGQPIIVEDKEIESVDDKNLKTAYEFKVANEKDKYKVYRKFIVAKDLEFGHYTKVWLQFEIRNSDCIFQISSQTNFFGDFKFRKNEKDSLQGEIYFHFLFDNFNRSGRDNKKFPSKTKYFEYINNKNIRPQIELPADFKFPNDIER